MDILEKFVPPGVIAYSFEAVEASVKAYYLAGKISREDLNCIFRKYGIL